MSQKAEWPYDVFISYSHTDRTWVHGELLRRLDEAGLTVCIDERNFRPGAPSVIEMEYAVVNSRRTVLVLTPAYLASDWAKFEALMVQTLDPLNEHLRLIPLLRERCELPIRIGIFTYVNFADPADLNSAWMQLLAALGSPSTSESMTIIAQHEVQRPVVQLGSKWNELVQDLDDRYFLAQEYPELRRLVEIIAMELQRAYPAERDLSKAMGWQAGIAAITKLFGTSSQSQQLESLLRDMRSELAQGFLEASERCWNQDRWREAHLLSTYALTLNPHSSDARNIQEYTAEALRRRNS